MSPILSAIWDLFTLKIRRRASLELEVLALRHQLKVLKRKTNSHKYQHQIKRGDRIVFIFLYRFFPGVLKFIRLVKPITIINWHKKGFRIYWSWKSRKHKGPPKKKDIEGLVLRFHRDNPLWGSRRIRHELIRLGYRVSDQTVLRYLNKFRRGPLPPSPTWRTFLINHMHEAVSIDSFVVFTASYRFLYAFLVLGLRRRKILHFAVTDQPNQTWMSEQISIAFQSKPRPKYLLRDRDSLYGGTFRQRLKRMGIVSVVAAPHSPWHNNYVESLISHIRNECLNHVIIFSKQHLERILGSYVRYYNSVRTHTSLGGDSPDHRPIQQRHEGRSIVAIPHVGGLHHHYERRKA